MKVCIKSNFIGKFLISSAAMVVLLCSAVNAKDAALWRMDPKVSKIEFTALHSGSKITGSFPKFSAKISFDKNSLSTSSVEIAINLAEFTLSYAEAKSTLENADWFNIKAFPQATFKSQKITKISENKFRIDGQLTLKGKSSPLSFDFNFAEFSDKKAEAIGGFSLNRASFGIGNDDTNLNKAVQDLVQVQFTVAAVR
jgi:polyisoprenoid-binding protein YceI